MSDLVVNPEDRFSHSEAQMFNRFAPREDSDQPLASTLSEYSFLCIAMYLSFLLEDSDESD